MKKQITMDNAISDTMEYIEFMLDETPNINDFFMNADMIIYDYVNKKYGKHFDYDSICEMHYVCCDMLSEIMNNR